MCRQHIYFSLQYSNTMSKETGYENKENNRLRDIALMNRQILTINIMKEIQGNKLEELIF